MNARERMLSALAGETPDQVPFGEPSVDQPAAQRIVGAAKYLSELEITRFLKRDLLPFDALPPIFADEVTGSDGQTFYTRPWIQNEADLERIDWPDPLDETFRKAAQECIQHRDEYAIVALIRLGISPTYISMGFERFFMALVENPAFVQEVLLRFTNWLAVRIDFLQEIGFDVMWTFDDIAYKSGLFMSPRMFRDVLLPVVQPTIRRIEVPWIFHSDGDFMDIVDDLVQEGVNGLHPFEPEAMDIRAVKQRYGSHLCVLGNVNVDTLARGTPEEVKEEVLDLLRDVAPYGGFVLTSSNSVPSYAKPKNVMAMVHTLQKYGRYPIQL